MSLTRRLKRNPRKSPPKSSTPHADPDFIDRIEIAGPGFINLFIQAPAWHEVLRDIARQPERYGRQDLGSGQRVQVDSSSANPTAASYRPWPGGRRRMLGRHSGRLRLPGRARILHQRCRHQMETLGRSLYYRTSNNSASPFSSRKVTPGQYMQDLARSWSTESATAADDRP